MLKNYTLLQPFITLYTSIWIFRSFKYTEGYRKVLIMAVFETALSISVNQLKGQKEAPYALHQSFS